MYKQLALMSDYADHRNMVCIAVILKQKMKGVMDMNENNIINLVTYRRLLLNFKLAYEDGVFDIATCNIALVGIARDLNIMNPILL